MKTITNRVLLFTIMLFAGFASIAQTTPEKLNVKSNTAPKMKNYLIERDIPNAGKLTPEELKAISQKSCQVLKEDGATNSMATELCNRR